MLQRTVRYRYREVEQFFPATSSFSPSPQRSASTAFIQTEPTAWWPLFTHTAFLVLSAERKQNQNQSQSQSEWELKQIQTYALSLTHLMEVGPPANNHYLSVAWVAQVRRQLPLSGPVPAHVKEDLDDDEYYNHSETQARGGDESDGMVPQAEGVYEEQGSTHMYQYSSMMVVGSLTGCSHTGGTNH